MEAIHGEPHPFAGQEVIIVDGDGDETPYLVEDWWDRVSGASWMFAKGNPACIDYAIRSSFDHLPIDNEVVYGKIGPFGHLAHNSEIRKAASE